MRDVLFVVFSKLHVFFGVYILIGVLTLAAAFLKAPIYEVKGCVLVKPVLEPSLKLMAPTPMNIRANPVTAQDINSEVSIMNSPQFLRDLTRKLGLEEVPAPDTKWGRLERRISNEISSLLYAWGLMTPASPEDRALARLQKDLDIKPVTLSNMIEISLRGQDPEGITRVMNTFLDSYIDYHIDIFRAKASRQFYAEQADFFLGSLKASEDALEAFKKQWSIIEITAQNRADIELLKILRENLTMVQAQIDEQRTKLQVQLNNFAQNGSVGAMTKELQNNNILEELVRVMGPLLTERERVGLHYQESSPKYMAVQRQVGEIEGTYKKRIEELLKGGELDLQGMIHYSAALGRNIEEVESRSLLLSQKQVEYDRLVREVTQNEKNYLLYLDKTEEARIEEQQDSMRVSNVTVTNWAEKPAIPVFPRKGLMILLAVVVGFVTSAAASFVAYYWDHSVKTPVDISRYSDLPVLASIQYVEKKFP